MKLDLTKVSYKDLNSKEKENYNYHKVAAALAEYGYDSMRLNNDWEGADFIAVKDEQMLKVQLKARFTLSKKYIGKGIFIAFREDNDIYIFDHDKAINFWGEELNNRKGWITEKEGLVSSYPMPKKFRDFVLKI
jgi:hypothetical protein